jgi:DNA-binding NtrC family response regulator
MLILVDENDLFRTALATNLRDDGFDVLEFSNQRTLPLEHLKDVEFLVIGCAIGVSEGIPLAKRFHAAQPRAKIIVLARTGSRLRLQVAPPDYVTLLPKPLEYETLERLLTHGSAS